MRAAERDARRARILELHRAGEHAPHIAERVGTSTSALCAILRAAGHVPRFDTLPSRACNAPLPITRFTRPTRMPTPPPGRPPKRS